MVRIIRAGAVALALVLVAAACGDDGDETDETTTTEEETTTTSEATTTTVVTTTVEFTFDGEVTEDEAEQSASTMERRIVKFRELAGESGEGTEVEVNDDGTGLDITVPGTEDEAEATELVDGLSFRGNLYFRPGYEQFPPPDDPSATPPAPQGADEAGDDTTTTAASEVSIPDTTPPAEDDPQGDAVLAWRRFETVEQLRDPEAAEILGLWRVGPRALTGDVIEDSEVTELDGVPAVKVVLAEGPDGLEAFNQMAQDCFDANDACPGGVYTVVLDSQIVVASIPRAGEETFTPFTQDDVIIRSEDWTEDVATTIAVAFEAGALPVSISPA